jgi:hypothetical protein
MGKTMEGNRSKEDRGDLDVVQANIKFSSLKEQSVFYGVFCSPDK